MRIEGLAVLVLPLQMLKPLRCFASDGDDLKRYHIDIARIDAPDVISEAKSLPTDHTREMEARDLAQRPSIAGVCGGGVNDDVVAKRPRRERPIYDFPPDPP